MATNQEAIQHTQEKAVKKIKSIILIIGLLLCINNLGPVQLYDLEATVFVEGLKLATMFRTVEDGIVYCYSGNSKTTGIFISKDGWILTAGHKVDRDFPSANPIYVKLTRTSSAEVYKSTKILPLAEGWDLLLFKIDFKPKFYFKRFVKFHLLQENWIFGFRLGSGKVPSGVGYITTNVIIPRLRLTTASSIAGNSGSPVLNRRGNVLGILVRGYEFGDSFFIPSVIVKEYIKFYKSEMKAND